MRKKKYGILRFLLRMDNFNRITVFITMVVFLVIPSVILFNINASTYSLSAIISCLSVLGMNLGIGMFTLYKPIRTSWFYYLACLISLVTNHNTFLNYQEIPFMEEYNLPGIFYTEVALASILLVVNLIFFFRSLYRYSKSTSMTSEKTNADSPYDFLNGGEINHDIEKQIRYMDKNNELLGKIKQVKISRTSRLISFLVLIVILLLVCFRRGFSKDSAIFSCIFSLLILAPSSFFSSLVLPGDFKYIYYYVAVFYSLIFILSTSVTGIPIWVFILVLAIHVISLLLTLITEGRTWTGNSIDSD